MKRQGLLVHFETTNRDGQRQHDKKSMGLFDKFKKKEEPHYDPSNMKIKDLRVGFMFDYDLNTWEITEEYEYDWGDNYFTREYKLEASDDTAYLHIDYNDEGFMTLSRKLKVRELGRTFRKRFLKKSAHQRKSLLMVWIIFWIRKARVIFQMILKMMTVGRNLYPGIITIQIVNWWPVWSSGEQGILKHRTAKLSMIMK
jgi:hypothetical protein